jgi:hypothetical protein
VAGLRPAGLGDRGADEAGDALAINTYDEYGQPGVSNTRQTWLPEVELYHYKARALSRARAEGDTTL